MKKKYVLKSCSGWVDTDMSRELDEFTEEDFKRYKEGKLTESETQNYERMAVEDQRFEWWIVEA